MKKTGISWRQMLNGGLVLTLVLTIFLYAWVHYQVVELGYQLVDVRRSLRVDQQQNKKLKTEIATLMQPARLEKIARQKCGLRYPDADQKVMLK
ncbi:MAG: cell division protein FtsL [Deltaproteobacteria bacterium]|nr:cell division protein FtsL [Candidatus Anaeroferrophillus wilburensis]MBN2888986.1 cell division protein FtsL [Deltaproteobacteria bacterium]